MTEGSWLSLLPSLLAIGFAIVTRRVVLALLGGVLLANLLYYSPDLLSAALGSVVSLSTTLIEPSNLQVWGFTLAIGALFGVLERGGTFIHFVRALERRQFADSKRKARLFTWVLGVVVFIESNVSIMTAGTTSRPLYDRLGISREKLAYLVDSTCAPICILIPLNAWGAFNLGLISAQDVANPLLTFAHSLLFNFYAMLAIVLALFVAWTGWSIGPMRTAERNVRPQQQQTMPEHAHNSGAARSVGISLLSMILMVPGMLWLTGGGSIVAGSGTTSVLVAVLVALTIATLGTRVALKTAWLKLGAAALIGARRILPLAVILWLAMVLGDMTRMLGTADYITSLLEGNLALWLLLPLIFLLSALTAFAIGSSWGTFAIMLPLAIPLALSLGLPPAPFIAAAISGGIFGDHASPISDTTIIASLAAGTEHIDHVRTQLPYALLAAALTVVLYGVYGIVTF